jgi:hypothetical protein
MQGDTRGVGTRIWDAAKAASPIGGQHGLIGSIVGAATLGVGIPGTGTGSSPVAGFNSLKGKPLPPVESLYSLANPASDADMRLLASHAAERISGAQNVNGEARDSYGHTFTPEGEQAARLATKGWDAMTPAERSSFHHLMFTGAVKQHQLAQGITVSPEDKSGVAGTAAQQFAEGGLQTAKMLLPPADAQVDAAQQQLLATNAAQYPKTAAVARFAGAVVDPVARAGAKAIGARLAPVIGETPGMVAAVRSGSPIRVVGALQGSALEGAAFGAAASTAQQATQGHIDPDAVMHEAANQAVLQPAFHATVGSAMEGAQLAAQRVAAKSSPRPAVSPEPIAPTPADITTIYIGGVPFKVRYDGKTTTLTSETNESNGGGQVRRLEGTPAMAEHWWGDKTPPIVDVQAAPLNPRFRYIRTCNCPPAAHSSRKPLTTPAPMGPPLTTPSKRPDTSPASCAPSPRNPPPPRRRWKLLATTTGWRRLTLQNH